MTLFAALAIPVRLAAQEQHEEKKQLWSAKNRFNGFRGDVTLLHSGCLVTTSVSTS
jgi:hypothetical protein